MENKRKHLEFLQLIITRMNVNSFLLKGWTVTLIAALFALAAKDANFKYIWITLFSTVLFWLLDGYYLSIERQYRKLYDEVRIKEENQINFDLNASAYNKGNDTWINCTFSQTLVLYYITLLLLPLLIKYLTN
jgi:hypothetical protein